MMTSRAGLGISFMAMLVLLNYAMPGDKRSIPAEGYQEWKIFGGSPDNIHYSTLHQINHDNAHELTVAWTYDSGDAFPNSEMECNPIMVHGVLYVTTPKLRLIALDAATGKLLWSFNPYEGQKVATLMRNRGVAYWESANDRRVFFVARPYLYALDATTGNPIASFGDHGRVDFREGLGRDPKTQSISATSPGVVYKNLLIMGSIVSEDLPASPGDIRAYDVHTGNIRWTFHTIPHPGEYGYDTWPKDAWTYTGGVNAWSGLSLDVSRGLVFAATGSAAFDFYGANRLGDDLFANCVLALRAATGERVWHFQGVKHDLWDRDFPAAPALVTVKRDGRLIDAVAQTTKSGYVFVLDRETGRPLFPIAYRKTQASDVDGEVTAATQPLPLKPPPFARQEFTEDMVTDRTPEAHRKVLERLRQVRSGPQFTPPSRQGTVIFPGFDGGSEWGGAAFDPETGLFYVNSNEMAWILTLVERPKTKDLAATSQVYATHCASCHRPDMRGTPPEFPSLVDVGARLTEDEIAKVLREGSGRMPNFSNLGERVIRAMSRYLATGKDRPFATPISAQGPHPLKYSMDGYNKFLDPDGYPAVKPPWGTLNAINLDTAEIVWKIPFGEFPDLVKKGMRNTGTENYGGPLVTAGGLLFIGATVHDRKFHVFDKATGKLLWETLLPASNTATPATYQVAGRQFVVVAAGGGKWGEPSQGIYVAFALPQ